MSKVGSIGFGKMEAIKDLLTHMLEHLGDIDTLILDIYQNNPLYKKAYDKLENDITTAEKELKDYIDHIYDVYYIYDRFLSTPVRPNINEIKNKAEISTQTFGAILDKLRSIKGKYKILFDNIKGQGITQTATELPIDEVNQDTENLIKNMLLLGSNAMSKLTDAYDKMITDPQLQ